MKAAIITLGIVAASATEQRRLDLSGIRNFVKNALENSDHRTSDFLTEGHETLTRLRDLIENWRNKHLNEDSTDDEKHDNESWSYPYIGEEWDHVNPVCTGGNMQSPINLPFADPNLMQETLNLQWAHNDMWKFTAPHGVHWDAESPLNTLTYGGTIYKMLQFHCHAGSEHREAYLQYDAECHFVHQAESGDYAVVGLFVSATSEDENAAFGEILSASDQAGDTVSGFKASSLIAETDLTQYWTYKGSFTTPPCTEGVQWIMLQDVLEISRSQFAELVPLGGPHAVDNFRPPQPLNGRIVFQGTQSSDDNSSSCVMTDTTFKGRKSKIEAETPMECYETCLATMFANGLECSAWAFKEGKTRPCILFASHEMKPLETGSGVVAGDRACDPSKGN